MIKQLNITNYEMYVILGNDDSEKHKKRKVIINICLRFSKKNKACCADDIDETICYAKLINFLDTRLRNAKFNLLERMTQFLYDEISSYLGDSSILKRIEVIKTAPPIDNLGSASFICSDW
ncbi:MAG: dihydroneopterin aldolase [Holosporaceae bacterium]|jgi:FolB domain-containing protein|nr:dihydroneopterin aldolase [Holosporaceae bacterium]